MIITAHKIMRLRKDGTFGPLFINASDRYVIGEWYEARHDTHRNGFAYRPGFHAFKDTAPHIKNSSGRAQLTVELDGVKEYERPSSQGGVWYVADRMRILGVESIGHDESSEGRGI